MITGARWRRRAYIVVVPVALFALWWLGWGHTAENHASLGNLAAAPKYVFDSIGAGDLVAVRARRRPRDEARVGALDWGRPLAALALVLAGGPAPPPRPGSPLALGRGRDRALLLGPGGLQPQSRPRRDREPLSVRRAGSSFSWSPPSSSAGIRIGRAAIATGGAVDRVGRGQQPLLSRPVGAEL